MTQANQKQQFDKKALSLTHVLHPYVKQRLRVGENLGILPRNMYKTNEIIDEAIVEIYEKSEQFGDNLDALKLEMFSSVRSKLRELMEKEDWHKDSISTKSLLDEELKQMEEEFTMDADSDLVMNEDLDDISYKQNVRNGLPYDDEKEGVIHLLDLQQDGINENWSNRQDIRKIYYQLTPEDSDLVDLYVLGKLGLNEIALLNEMSISEVKQKIDSVRETFKKQLD